MSPADVTLADVRAAADRIAGAVVRTPCTPSPALSALLGCDVWCKLDSLQRTGSFKERGARNRLVQLTDAEKARGVVAASAGNHALGLAYHGGLLGVPVTVVMPRFAPLVKVTNCRAFGANVINHGESFDEARAHACQLAEQHGFTYVHGFDDPAVIAGQGTVGLEILEDVPDADAVLVPIGGGGLIAGIALVVKALRPQTRLIGVEAERAPTFAASRAAGKPVRVDAGPTLADGLAIAEVGHRCFRIADPLVDDVVLVGEPALAQAVLRLVELEKAVVEGAGAAPLAALADGAAALGLAGKKVVLVLCGGNIDVTTLARVIERGLAASGRLCRVSARISDRPGSLARLATTLGALGASIKELHHDRAFDSGGDASSVRVLAVLETRDAAHVAELHAALRAAGVEFAAA